MVALALAAVASSVLELDGSTVRNEVWSDTLGVATATVCADAKLILLALALVVASEVDEGMRVEVERAMDVPEVMVTVAKAGEEEVVDSVAVEVRAEVLEKVEEEEVTALVAAEESDVLDVAPDEAALLAADEPILLPEPDGALVETASPTAGAPFSL